MGERFKRLHTQVNDGYRWELKAGEEVNIITSSHITITLKRKLPMSGCTKSTGRVHVSIPHMLFNPKFISLESVCPMKCRLVRSMTVEDLQWGV